MTIKISQLANLTVVQANTIVPVVSNITGTLTTVQANIQQLQNYIIANGVSANITALYANASTQSDLIIGINANLSQANLGMKGYVDNLYAVESVANINMKNYVDGQITAANTGVTAANVGIIGYIGLANTSMKGYVNGQITAANTGVTTANIGMIGYVNGQVLTANTGMIGYVGAQVTTANLGMKGYVDSQIATIGGSSYGNANVQAFLPVYDGFVGANLEVGGNITYIYNPLSIGFPSSINYANTVLAGTNSANGYVQLNIQNIDSVGNLVSADFIATAPNGTDTSHYIDIGINGNNWSSGSWTVSGANDGYVYINQGNLTLGTDTAGTTVKVHVGGTLTSNVVTTFANTGLTVTGNIIPSANVTYSLGNVTHQWKELFVSNSTIYVGGYPITCDSGGNILFNNEQIATFVIDSSGKLGIGNQAGAFNQEDRATAIGNMAGAFNQGGLAVALGAGSGYINQGANAVAIGSSVGYENQGNAAIGIGRSAGGLNQGEYAVSIGYYGNNIVNGTQENQGAYSISIGYKAGLTSQPSKSIIVNANDEPLNAISNIAGLYINPVRSDSGNVSQIVYYNTTTKELTYSSNANISGNLIVGHSYIPSLANSAGTAGQIVWDSGYIYVCIATNTWKRATLSTW